MFRAILLLQVTRADYLSGRTALHFAAVSGHARCIRLVVADFVQSVPNEALHAQTDGDRVDGTSVKNKYDQRCEALTNLLNMQIFPGFKPKSGSKICFSCL